MESDLNLSTGQQWSQTTRLKLESDLACPPGSCRVSPPGSSRVSPPGLSWRWSWPVHQAAVESAYQAAVESVYQAAVESVHQAAVESVHQAAVESVYSGSSGVSIQQGLKLESD